MSNVVLEASHLTKRYGSLTAVDDLSLQILEGEVLGLLGPNGAGKTTTINILVGLLKPDEGEVMLHHKPVTSETAQSHPRVGVCPQEITIWRRLTCIEQLTFIGEMYGLKAQEASKRGQSILERLELEEKRDSRGSTLSGGMQRRLNLAMSLVHDPEILVLDEPEAGLDPQSRVLVREYLKSLAREKTIILTTHNMDEADRVSDRVAIIDQGKLMAIDTPAALKASIGSGDVLEIDLAGERIEEHIFDNLINEHKGRVSVETTPNTLILRGMKLVRMLPVIIEQLDKNNVPFEEIHLRENTLEDVFIHLTGRRLRE